MSNSPAMTAENRPDLLEELFDDERKSGEMLVARFRLVILLLFIPAIFALRFFLGFLVPSYWLLSIAKWIFMCLVSGGIYYVLRRNYYRPWIGFATLMVDITFVTFSIITLSFYKFSHTGVLQDSLFIIYYLICVSSGIRYDLRYTLFNVPVIIAIFIVLCIFDRSWHGISIDYILLIDRLSLVILVSIMGVALARKLKEYVFARYSMSEKHIGEISSLLEIGRKISSRGELNRTLSNIALEIMKLLHREFGYVMLPNRQMGGIEVIAGRAMPKESIADDGFACRLARRVMGSSAAVQFGTEDAHPPASDDPDLAAAFRREGIRSAVGLPVIVDGTSEGALIAAGTEEKEFSAHDLMLLGVLSEQAAISIKNASLLDELHSESVYLHDELDHSTGFQNIIGISKKMKAIFGIIEKAAHSNIPVLIRGESGTGKELIANALQSLGARENKPYIKVNCSAIPSSLLESELFGHEKGAFTGANRRHRGKFELANLGTIFLDEIGDMSLDLQIKLLRVLQEGEFERIGGETTTKIDVRLITATNQNLEEKIKRGEFREDLFYRINGLPVFIPPLRERREDIPILVNHFIKKYDHTGARKLEFTISAMRYLTLLEWRGNVRELENLVHRVLIMTDSDTISEKELKSIYNISDTSPIIDFYSSLKDYIESSLMNGCDLSLEIERIEKEFLVEAMRLAKGNIRKAGDSTGLPKSTLFNKLQKYRISPE